MINFPPRSSARISFFLNELGKRGLIIFFWPTNLVLIFSEHHFNLPICRACWFIKLLNVIFIVILSVQLSKQRVAKEHESFTLTCDVIGGETGIRYSWKENGSVLINETSNELIFDFVDREQDGLVYECMVTSQNNITGSASGTLVVYGK